MVRNGQVIADITTSHHRKCGRTPFARRSPDNWESGEPQCEESSPENEDRSRLGNTQAARCFKSVLRRTDTFLRESSQLGEPLYGPPDHLAYASDDLRATARIEVSAAKRVQFEQPQARIRFAHVKNVDRVRCSDSLRHLGGEPPR